MKKIVSPCIVDGLRAFAKITYENGRLSICGVIAPMPNGNCKGSAGQCVNEIRAGDPTDGWTDKMLEKFCDFWDEYHLNDMKPYCKHQKQLGWDKISSKKVPLYHYTITREAANKKREVEKAALAALRDGKAFIPTEEQVIYARLPYSITSHEEINNTYFEPKKPLYTGDADTIEYKTLGWLRPEEHPDGILCKPCPVCGYKYGSAWKTEEVPIEVINWLFALPNSKVTPAWI